MTLASLAIVRHRDPTAGGVDTRSTSRSPASQWPSPPGTTWGVAPMTRTKSPATAAWLDPSGRGRPHAGNDASRRRDAAPQSGSWTVTGSMVGPLHGRSALDRDPCFRDGQVPRRRWLQLRAPTSRVPRVPRRTTPATGRGPLAGVDGRRNAAAPSPCCCGPERFSSRGGDALRGRRSRDWATAELYDPAARTWVSDGLDDGRSCSAFAAALLPGRPGPRRGRRGWGTRDQRRGVRSRIRHLGRDGLDVRTAGVPYADAPADGEGPRGRGRAGRQRLGRALRSGHGAWRARRRSAGAVLPHGDPAPPAPRCVTGGQTPAGQPIASAEVYDPLPAPGAPRAASAARGTRTARSCSRRRAEFSSPADWAPTGSLASAELYNIKHARWTAAAPLASARSRAVCALLPNGRALFAGGVALEGFSGIGGGG